MSMLDADLVVKSLCEAYAGAVNRSDSAAYSRLFEPDAIRIPPGEEPEQGRDAIRAGEQASYDIVRLNVRSTPRDVVALGSDWIYAIADIEGDAVPHAGGERSFFRATKTWLLRRQGSGEWLIARQMWNMKPAPRARGDRTGT